MLMTFVLITGLGLGWIALVTCQALVQSHHIAQIKGIGGRVMYDWEWRGGAPLPPGSNSPWRQWLIANLGPDFVGEPIALSVGSRGKLADDALMTHVGRLGRLEYLSLSDTAVSDAGLAELRAFTRLKELHLQKTAVQGPGLVHLAGMKDLEELVLPTYPFTDADLAPLKGLTKLKKLKLEGRNLTNAGLTYLGGLTRLEELTLRNTSITSLEPIRHLTSLRSLDVVGSPIDDAGLEPVARLRELEVLRLSGTLVGDVGTASICVLPRLQELDLDRTRVGDSGLARLCELPRIADLTLSQTEVTDEGLLGLAGKLDLTPCENLLVSGPKVTAAGIESLRSKLPKVQVNATDLKLTKLPLGAGR
jgi:internalin A